MGRHRFARQKGSRIWTSVMFSANQALADGVAQQAIIATQGDWSSATGDVGVTLLTIRGYISVVTNAAADMSCQWWIGTVDADVVGANSQLNPAAVATYVDEDVLLTGGYQWEASSTEGHMWDVNVRTMRKLDRQKHVFLQIVMTGGAGLMTTLLRGLVKLG